MHAPFLSRRGLPFFLNGIVLFFSPLDSERRVGLDPRHPMFESSPLSGSHGCAFLFFQAPLPLFVFRIQDKRSPYLWMRKRGITPPSPAESCESFPFYSLGAQGLGFFDLARAYAALLVALDKGTSPFPSRRAVPFRHRSPPFSLSSLEPRLLYARIPPFSGGGKPLSLFLHEEKLAFFPRRLSMQRLKIPLFVVGNCASLRTIRWGRFLFRFTLSPPMILFEPFPCAGGLAHAFFPGDNGFPFSRILLASVPPFLDAGSALAFPGDHAPPLGSALAFFPPPFFRSAERTYRSFLPSAFFSLALIG